MRFKIVLLCLLLLSFFVGCSSNKNADQAATTEPANTAQQDQTSNTSSAAAAPAAEKPASAASEKPAATREHARHTENAAMKEAPAPPPPPAPVVIPAGTSLTVRTQSPLSSNKSQAGDSFSATLDSPIIVDGKEVVASGSQLEGTVVDAKAKGKVKGEARLQLKLTSLRVKGTSYPIETSMAGFTEKGKGKRTAVTTAGGAGLGALIGGLTGGGKGAAIGAAVGGGAGFAGGAFTGNKQIELPAESALTFKLNNSITLK